MVAETSDTHTRPPRHDAKITITTESSIKVLEPIRFDGLSATITLPSIPMLDALAETLGVARDRLWANRVARPPGGADNRPVFLIHWR
ncbi:MAG: hypothetical protein JWO36_937 [Myxococcales bacterium]|nr:hypothetical protein [Myxococcales bacterium]